MENLAFVIASRYGLFRGNTAFIVINARASRNLFITKDGRVLQYEQFSSYPDYPRADFVEACKCLNPEVSIPARCEIYEEILKFDALPTLPAPKPIIIGKYEVEFFPHHDFIVVGFLRVTREQVIEVAKRMGIITK